MSLATRIAITRSYTRAARRAYSLTASGITCQCHSQSIRNNSKLKVSTRQKSINNRPSAGPKILKINHGNHSTTFTIPNLLNSFNTGSTRLTCSYAVILSHGSLEVHKFRPKCQWSISKLTLFQLNYRHSTNSSIKLQAHDYRRRR